MKLIAVILFLSLGCVGCVGSTSKITAKVAEVRVTASRIVTNAARIVELAVEGSEVDLKAKEILVDAGVIEKACDDIQAEMPKVQNMETTLDRLVRVGLPVLGIVAVIILAWRFGIDRLIRPLMQRIGRWITPTDKRDAALDAKVTAGDIDIKEAVAARRASRPGYEAAWKTTGGST